MMTLMQSFARVVATWLFSVLAGVPLSVNATTYRLQKLERLADEADFVGIVECVAAGGIVARCRVEDSWKGPPKGTEFVFQMSPDPQGAQFPIILCGQRLFVTAFEKRPEIDVHSATALGMGGCPLWWRSIVSDFELPFPHEFVLLKGDQFLWTHTTGTGSLSEFKNRIVSFLALSDQERERRHLIDEAIYHAQGHGSGSFYDRYSKMLEGLATFEAVAGKILQDATATSDPYVKSRLLDILSDGGAAQTLLFLRQRKAEMDAKEFARVEAALELKLRKLPQLENKESPRIPPSEEIEAASDVLNQFPWGRRAHHALFVLAKHAPALAVNPLKKWTPSAERARDLSAGYDFGSIFGFVCHQDKEKHLVELLEARDSFVRVAAAVYLRHSNPELANPKLKEFCSSGGDPGVWAALVLASSGDKSAVPRALEVFSTAESPWGYETVHRWLQLRVKVLLSNSARHSRVAPPNFELAFSEQYFDDPKTVFYKPCLEWWKQNESKIKMHDPWLPMLDKQSVD